MSYANTLDRSQPPLATYLQRTHILGILSSLPALGKEGKEGKVEETCSSLFNHVTTNQEFDEKICNWLDGYV